MDVRLTWTNCDESGDYVLPNVLSPRDLVFRPDNMDETVLHTHKRAEQIRDVNWSPDIRTFESRSPKSESIIKL